MSIKNSIKKIFRCAEHIYKNENIKKNENVKNKNVTDLLKKIKF